MTTRPELALPKNDDTAEGTLPLSDPAGPAALPHTEPPAVGLPPQPGPPTLTVQERQLVENVCRALRALPAHFKTDTNVSGLDLADLFTLNTTLGAAIEKGTVNALNNLRDIWDPTGEYADCHFVRYSESFPDVRLERVTPEPDEKPILGIELKGWFILAKEKEPTFRYKVTPGACAPADLLCVVPWFLDGAISGRPRVLAPYVESARLIAEQRNYWWKYLRDNKGPSVQVIPPEDVEPYPPPRAKSQDVPKHDQGGNFGRISRVLALSDGQPTKVMGDFIERVLFTELAGVPAKHWITFILATSKSDEGEIDKQLARIGDNPAPDVVGLGERVLRAIVNDL